MERTEQKVKLGQVTRRDAEWSDFPLFKEWRNSPHIYQTMLECPRPLTDEEVAEWLGSFVNDTEHRFATLGIISVDGKPVGWQMARDFQSGIPEIGLVIADQSYWGSGLADLDERDKLGLDLLRQKGFTKVRARARQDNPRVKGLLFKLGYTKIYENEEETVWIKDI